MKLVIWALVLLVQNASFTLVSRARNSGSLWFHGIASTLSNGIWFISQFFVVSTIFNVAKTGDWLTGIGYGLWYVLWTVIGSVTMHYVSMKYLETGKRAVGAK